MLNPSDINKIKLKYVHMFDSVCTNVVRSLAE